MWAEINDTYRKIPTDLQIQATCSYCIFCRVQYFFHYFSIVCFNTSYLIYYLLLC